MAKGRKRERDARYSTCRKRRSDGIGVALDKSTNIRFKILFGNMRFQHIVVKKKNSFLMHILSAVLTKIIES